jgi:hypothetical protein
MRSKQFAVCAIAGLLLGAMAHQARATFTINIFQNGSDVDAVGSGSFNLSALTLGGTDEFSQAAIDGASGVAELGTGGFDQYSGFTGPSSFGSPDIIGLSSAAAGPYAGVNDHPRELELPTGYTSGTFFSDSATYSNQTLATLDLTPGVYDYTWGSGPTADSLVVDIGAAPVPEPVSASLVAVGGLLMLRRRRVSR